MATAKWLLGHTSRLRFANRLEELNARYGPAPEVPLQGWLDHYPQTADEWRAVGLEPPVQEQPPAPRPRGAPSQTAAPTPTEAPSWMRPRW